MTTPTLTAAFLTMAALLLTAGCGAMRAGYETAPYQLVRSAGKHEVRDYPALTVIVTPMAGPGGKAGFSRLFRFISGDNDRAQKISMTTPVFMSAGESDRTMSFVLPANLESGRVPRPADGSVEVRALPPGRFAVLRFSGRRTVHHEQAALDELKSWMAAEGLRASSPPVYGYFDPPWTPPFLRRNEVMLRLDADVR